MAPWEKWAEPTERRKKDLNSRKHVMRLASFDINAIT